MLLSPSHRDKRASCGILVCPQGFVGLGTSDKQMVLRREMTRVVDAFMPLRRSAQLQFYHTRLADNVNPGRSVIENTVVLTMTI
jgi:hypothetical protein